MKVKDFDDFWNENRPGLIATLKALIPDISDDMVDSENDDDIPYMQITISISKDANTWSYQTGDNSFTGSCYGDPYWGIGYLTRECDIEILASELINSLYEVVEFED